MLEYLNTVKSGEKIEGDGAELQAIIYKLEDEIKQERNKN